MHVIRVTASEKVRYERESEVDNETLEMLRDSLEDPYATSSDFCLHSVDIVDGELEDVEIDVLKDGKWAPLELTN